MFSKLPKNMWFGLVELKLIQCWDQPTFIYFNTTYSSDINKKSIYITLDIKLYFYFWAISIINSGCGSSGSSRKMIFRNIKWPQGCPMVWCFIVAHLGNENMENSTRNAFRSTWDLLIFICTIYVAALVPYQSVFKDSDYKLQR